MSENKFRESEVVRIRGKDYPLLAGRIRLALEGGHPIAVRSELLRFDPGELAVSKVTVETTRGAVTAHGVASADRDPDFIGSLVELSESRAWSRALRWGFGAEVGFEELGAGGVLDDDAPRQDHPPSPPPARTNGNGHRRPTPATGAQKRAISSLARRLGREPDDVVQGLVAGADLDNLSLAEASSVIDKLKAKAGNGHGNGHSVEGRR